MTGLLRGTLLQNGRQEAPTTARSLGDDVERCRETGGVTWFGDEPDGEPGD